MVHKVNEIKVQHASNQMEIVERELSVKALGNWILSYADRLGVEITNMALNKLVFFLYERVLIEKRQILTNAKIEAWEHGPVFREIYHSFKEHGDKPIKSRARSFSPKTRTLEVVESRFASDDEAYFEEVLAPYVKLSAARLREISHIENGPWHKVWWYEGEANPGMEITPNVILDSQQDERLH